MLRQIEDDREFGIGPALRGPPRAFELTRAEDLRPIATVSAFGVTSVSDPSSGLSLRPPCETIGSSLIRLLSRESATRFSGYVVLTNGLSPNVLAVLSKSKVEYDKP